MKQQILGVGFGLIMLIIGLILLLHGHTTAGGFSMVGGFLCAVTVLDVKL